MNEQEALLAEFSRAWGVRDLDAVVELFAEDGVYAASVGPEPGTRAEGKLAIRAAVAKMFNVDDGAVTETTPPILFDGGAFWTWRYTLSDGTVELGCDYLEMAAGKITLKDAYRKTR